MSFFEIDSRFLIDTAFHRLEIIRDDGLYRHLRMQQPGHLATTTTLSHGLVT